MDDESHLGRYRYFLKDTIRREIDFSRTDQNRGVPPPPIEKPFACRGEANRTDRSRRVAGHRTDSTWRPQSVLAKAAADSSTIRLHWTNSPSSCGPRKVYGNSWVAGRRFGPYPRPGRVMRWRLTSRCKTCWGWNPASIATFPLEHRLLFEFQEEDTAAKLVEVTLGQSFVARAAVTFIWTTVPYRTEWRYGLAAHKVIAIDAGHVCQNLYLACEAIGAGTCAIAAYHQELIDQLLRIDGKDEFTIYLAPVGKVGQVGCGGHV